MVPFVEDCQATVGTGAPEAAAVNVTVLATVTVWLTGANVTAGATANEKLVADAGASRPLTKLIGPVVTPVGTTAVMLVAETTTKLVAASELNLTAVVPVRLVPVMVTVAPTAAAAGVNEVMP